MHTEHIIPSAPLDDIISSIQIVAKNYKSKEETKKKKLPHHTLKK